MSDETRRAIELWCWYEVICDEWDDLNLTGRRDGESHPANPTEHAAMLRFARDRKREMHDIAEDEGVTRDELTRVKRTVERMSRREREDIVRRAPPFPTRPAPAPDRWSHL